ncbi:MAG: hypothetical protein ACTSRZ_08240 [Promethearchaeota archaeon]
MDSSSKNNNQLNKKIIKRRRSISGKNINKLRYYYFMDYKFFYFIAGISGIISSLLFLAIEKLILSFNKSEIFQTNYTLIIVIINIIYLISFIFAYFISKGIILFIFSVERKLIKKINLFSAIIAFIFTNGILFILLTINKQFIEDFVINSFIFYLINANSTLFLTFGIILIVLTLVATLIPLIISKKLLIYPNRIKFGKLILYYENFVNVFWGTGSIEERLKRLPEKSQFKELKILTSICFESKGKDFSIIHYYAIIEDANSLYIMQPIFWRNSFVQNIRNGWIERWRWDGSFEKPDDWIPPKVPKPY